MSKVDPDRYVAADGHIRERVMCPSCWGRATYGGDRCQTCQGTGRVWRRGEAVGES